MIEEWVKERIKEMTEYDNDFSSFELTSQLVYQQPELKQKSSENDT